MGALPTPPRRAAVILAGGRSTRMGAPKAWLDFHGEPLLARVVRRVAPAASLVVIVAAPGQDLPPLPESVVVVRDPVEGRGPVQGLAAGLGAVFGLVDAAFVGSTDAPFVHPAFIGRLFDLLEPDLGAVVPRAQGHTHPLSAVYARSALPVVEAFLARGGDRLVALLERLPTCYVEPRMLVEDAALASVDPELRALMNVNTPEGLELARRLPDIAVRL